MYRGYRNRANGARPNGARRPVPPFLLRRLILSSLPPVRRRLPLPAKLLIAFLLLSLLGVASGLGAAAGTYFYYAQSLQGQLDRLENRRLFETTKVYDRHGELLYEFFSEGRRTRLESLDQVPQHLIWATLSIEDKTFYQNPGVDPVGIARAALGFFATGRIVGGGSTLTQQFIRKALFTPQEQVSPSLERKIKEAILALELTRRVPKDEILLMYFNEVYYGNLSYGIEAAAQSYFGKHAWELDLAESAFLAGLPQLPDVYAPFTYGELDPVKLERAKARQRDVLNLMVENGYITRRQADAAYQEELHFASPLVSLKAPHFVMYIRQLLEEDPNIGPEKLFAGGLRITTTLDMRYQRLAEAIVREQMQREDLIAFNAHNAALVAMRPDTGEILAMVGSVDYNLVQPSLCGREGNVVDGNVNAALAERQPGSAFKPFTYITAFSMTHDMYTPATMVLDVRTEFPVPGHDPYVPKNYDNKYHGPVRLRNALGSSLNMPAVKVLQHAGVEQTIHTAHRFGITGLKRGMSFYGLSLTLGGGEVRLLDMVNAYSTFANEGRHVPPVAILKITDSQGNVLYEYKPRPLEEYPRVADARFVYLINHILSDDTAREMAFGPHSILYFDRPVAVKTGTSEDWGDNWCIGYTPYLAVGVWMGNNNNEPMTANCQPREKAERGIPGSRGSGHIWHYFMEAIFNPEKMLPKYFPDEEQRLALFGDGDLMDILRDANGRLREDFRRPEGIVEQEVCAISGKRPIPGVCPVVKEIFVEGTQPAEDDLCPVHKVLTVVRIPGTDPPQYCLPLEGVSYPPELVQQQVFLDLYSVAKPEEIAGLEEWMQTAGIPRAPTEFCPPDLGTYQPGEPGQPPPQNRWAGLVRAITYPRRYAGITGPIEIRGSADLVSSFPQDQFDHYKVEWGQKGPSGEMPTEWHLVASDVGRTPVHNGVLAVWDPGDLPDGSYVLRLTVVTREGRPRFDGDEPGHTYVPVYLDRGPIFVRLLSPQPGSVLRQSTVTLVAKVEGVSPAARVDFFYGDPARPNEPGIFIGSAITNTVYPLSERIYTVTWPVRQGQFVLSVEAVNTAGRRATSQKVYVIGQPPQGSLPGNGDILAALSSRSSPSASPDGPAVGAVSRPENALIAPGAALRRLAQGSLRR